MYMYMYAGWQEPFKLPLQEPDLQISHLEAKNHNNNTVKQTILHCQWLMQQWQLTQTTLWMSYLII